LPSWMADGEKGGWSQFQRPELWIRDIFVWFRIRGSIELRIRILLFSSVAYQMSIKKFFFKLFAFYLLKLHLPQSSKIKIIKKSQKSKNQLFCWTVKGSGSIQIMPDPDPQNY
jgi:hypothetical protein